MLTDPSTQPSTQPLTQPFTDFRSGPLEIEPCPRCGGSGVLRLDGQRFRTCLHCLGQGQMPPLQAATTTAALRLRARPDREMAGSAPVVAASLSDAAASSSVAR
jgi:hypothetical protein